MIKKIKGQSVFFTLMTIAMFAFAVFFLCKCWIHLSAFPGAVNEYREAADVQLTQSFLNGENPYLLKSLDSQNEMPPVLYQYSFLNSAISALFALILGGNVVLAHYIVATLCMIGSGILTYLLIDRYSQETALPMLGAVLVLFCHWRFGYLSTTPNSLGIFLTLLTFTVAVSPKIKGRAILSAFLCVLLFYTKLYFVTIAGAIFIFYLLYNRKEAGIFLGMGIFQGAVSVLLIQWLWPLYYTYSFYFINGTTMWQALTKHLSAAPGVQIVADAGVFAPWMISIFLVSQSPIAYVLEQFRFMLNCFGLLFLALLVSLVTAVVKKRKIHVEEGDVLTLAILQVILQGLALFYLGRADGAYLSYFLQLWMPYVIIAALICVCRYIWFSKKFLNLGMVAALSFLSIYLGYHKLPLFMMTEDDLFNWQQAKSYVETYEKKNDSVQHVFYMPELAYLAMEQGKRAYENGHVSVARERALKAWESDKYARLVFPEAGRIIERNASYQEKINDDIRNRRYDLVTVNEIQVFVDRDLLTKSGYKKIDVLPLAVGNAHYDVEFWIPEDNQ